MFYAVTEAFNTLRDFMSAGGSVLWLIAILAAFMWAIILERIWYFNAGHQVYMGELKAEWDSVSDHASWKGTAIKEKLISQARTEVNRYLPLINTCVALAPLFGLLGTVTGMIEVFQVMAFTGGQRFKNLLQVFDFITEILENRVIRPLSTCRTAPIDSPLDTV